MKGVTEPRSLRILVVENHADTLRWLTLYLEDAGHSVSQARTVAEAAPKLSGRTCDVLLSDIGLPDGTGWQLLSNVEVGERPSFAIAMSGFGMNADTERSAQAGFQRHLVKPLKIAELDEVLGEAAEAVEARRD